MTRAVVTRESTTGALDQQGTALGVLNPSAVTAGTYGDATHVAQITLAANGTATGASNVAISFPADAVTSVFGRTGAVVAATNDYSEAQLSFTDITTNNVSTSKHGFAPKLPNDASKYLDGTGAYSVPSGGGGTVSSVFGRTGAVVAATNDYSIAQIQNAAAAVGGVLWTSIVAASDQDITSNTTLTDDNELFFTAASGAAYEVECTFAYSSPAGGGTPDIKLSFGETGTTSGNMLWWGINPSDVQNNAFNLTNLTAVFSFGTATTARISRGIGHHAGGGGTFKIQWAQNTSSGNATRRLAGSILRYRRIV